MDNRSARRSLSAPPNEGVADAAEASPGPRQGENLPAELPILPVRNSVVFPGTVVPLSIGRDKSKRLIDAVLAGNKLLAVFTQRKEDVEDPGIDDIYRVGTAATVLKLLRMPDGANTLLVHGMVRVGLEEIVATEPFWRARINPHEDVELRDLQLEALVYSARRTAEKILSMSPNAPDDAVQLLNSIEKAGALADFLAANLSLGVVQKQELLETFDIRDRLRKINATLQNQLEILELSQKIQTDVRDQMEKSQREYYLQQQMRAIQKELGQADVASERDELRRKVDEAGMPEAVLREANRELERLGRIPPASPEHAIARDYVEWLCEMPWDDRTEDNLDLDRASAILDEDHYGLEPVKRRILEYLAVRKLKPDGRGPILCFVGPPGVGKTSLGQSIARALNRNFIRLALGGVRDEADIRGHRRTYIGAVPGRIVQEIRKAGTRNPVMMLDEMDKLGSDFRGDPAAALLEVLDPEQNQTFTDHYLAVPFDLSEVFFIGTANYIDPVPAPLRDRMEVVRLPGYTAAEKLEIARRYLVPRQIDRNGLAEHAVDFSDEALSRIIEEYTREAGVRNLERSIGAVCRGLAAKIARGQKSPKKIGANDLSEFLGPPRYDRESALTAGVPGVATGLAYTPVGGEIIFVEAARMPGRGGFQLTGQIGDIMRESALAAMSLVRSRGESWGIPRFNVGEMDVHIHVPSGGIPKDGPSAGVAMLAALVSLFRNEPVLPTVAMTGEITLRGLVLPVGGIKEKVLAAHRSGIKTVILPARNEPDLVDVPQDVRKQLKFVLVSQADEVLKAAFGSGSGMFQPERRGKPVARKDRPRPRPARKTASKPSSKPRGRR